VVRYLTHRLGMTMAVVLVVTVFLALLVHVIPGDPAKVIMGPRASPAFAEQIRHEMGLDQPLWSQVTSFLWDALRGDLGRDFVTDQPVLQILLSYLPHTIILAFTALGMAAAIGIPLGVYSATHTGKLADHVVSLVSISMITMPSYVSGLFLLLLFPVVLGVLPATGAGDITRPAEYVTHLILPATALAVVWIGYLARIVRTSMLEVLGSNYIRAGRALGLGERLIAYRYALKNAIVPTVALLGVSLGDLLGGAVFVEVIFARPGLGSLLVDAIADRNYPIVRGGVLLVAVLFVAANLAADLSYRFLDPRIRVEKT
jgi:peptide/nickel transport system permease protein